MACRELFIFFNGTGVILIIYNDTQIKGPKKIGEAQIKFFCFSKKYGLGLAPVKMEKARRNRPLGLTLQPMGQI
jgi:hypothetical protein